MIVVLATIELHPGKRPDFLAEFRQIVPKVRAEDGCIEYFPAVDTASGLPVRSRIAPRRISASASTRRGLSPRWRIVSGPITAQ